MADYSVALLQASEFRDLVRLHASGEFTDAGAAHLASLGKLQELSLSSLNMSDDAFTFLGSMSVLRKLSLGRRRLTREFAEYLGNIPRLEELRLAVEEADDDSVELLESLQNRLPRCKIERYR